MYDGRENRLFESWDGFKNKIILYFKQNVKDKDCSALLKSLPELNAGGFFLNMFIITG